MADSSPVFYHHYASGDVDYSKLTEQLIDDKCSELFSKSPIPFVAKKGD